MKRHPDRTVSLSAVEQEIASLYVQLVADENMGIEEAARHALSALPNPDPEFVLWLSRETLVRVGDTTYSVAELDATS